MLDAGCWGLDAKKRSAGRAGERFVVKKYRVIPVSLLYDDFFGKEAFSLLNGQ